MAHDRPLRAFLLDNAGATKLTKTDFAAAIEHLNGTFLKTIDLDAQSFVEKAQNQAPFLGPRLDRMEKVFLIIVKLSQALQTRDSDSNARFIFLRIPTDLLVRFDSLGIHRDSMDENISQNSIL